MKKGTTGNRDKTLLAVAHILVEDFTIEQREIANLLEVKVQDISFVMKKIQSKINDGHIIIGLSDDENEKLRISLEMRERAKKFEDDKLACEVARQLINDHRITYKEIARRINKKPDNITDVMKKIQTRCSNNEAITGLTENESAQLKENLVEREVEIQMEKERRQQEREMAAANREAMQDMYLVNKRKSASKKPATISTEGLADWNRMHYDHVTGDLLMSSGVPADLPRRYPRKQVAVMSGKNDSYIEPVAKAMGTASGRRGMAINAMN